jgi:hypothetical protein
MIPESDRVLDTFGSGTTTKYVVHMGRMSQELVEDKLVNGRYLTPCVRYA